MNKSDDREQDVTEAMRALPEVLVPADIWQTVQDRLDQQERPDRTGRWLAAIAACVLPLLVALALVIRPDPPHEPMALSDLEARIAALESRSQRFESELSALPDFNPAQAPTLLALEGRLAVVDARLNGRAQRPNATDEQLWRTRADLIESYARLRRDETEALLQRAMY